MTRVSPTHRTSASTWATRPLRATVTVGLFLLLFVPSGAHAAPEQQTAWSHTTGVVFRIHVAGQVKPGMTLWVAYGPLAGRFGVFRLQSQGGSVYHRTLQLPVGVRGEFVYVEGHGQQRTRAGLVPGGMVTTIGHVGPLIIGHATVPLLRWQPPSG